MGKALFSFFDILMMEEVGLIVSEARKNGTTLSTSSVLARVANTYPNLEVAEEDVVQEAVMAAANAGVPIEIGTWSRPHQTATESMEFHDGEGGLPDARAARSGG